MPSEQVSDVELYLNMKAAARQGVTLSDKLVKSAAQVIR
jgi:putative ABC transport system substrate-binding protein